MYPSSVTQAPSDRVEVDSESAAFYAGTQFWTFREVTLAAGATFTILSTRPVPTIFRRFEISLSEGEVRCEVAREPTLGGTWSETLPTLARNSLPSRPQPLYTAKNTMKAGGTATGGTLIDLLIVKTAGSTAQSASVGGTSRDAVGAPIGNTAYRCSNPGNSQCKFVISILWEEVP